MSSSAGQSAREAAAAWARVRFAAPEKKPRKAVCAKCGDLATSILAGRPFCSYCIPQ